MPGCCLIITGPLQAAQLFKALVAHAGVIGAEATQFIPGAFGRRLAPVMAQSTRQVVDDGQVVARLARWIEGFAHLWTRRSLLVTVPSDSHQLAAAGNTTCASPPWPSETYPALPDASGHPAMEARLASASDCAGFSPMTYSAVSSPRSMASNMSLRC